MLNYQRVWLGGLVMLVGWWNFLDLLMRFQDLDESVFVRCFTDRGRKLGGVADKILRETIMTGISSRNPFPLVIPRIPR